MSSRMLCSVRDAGFQVQGLREAVTELLAAFHEFSPGLRRTLQQEHHFDAEQWEHRLGELLRAPRAPESVAQNELFDCARCATRTTSWGTPGAWSLCSRSEEHTSEPQS